MGEQRVSQGGIPYLTAILKQKARVVTEVALWKIRHRSGQEEISLKVGRYNLDGGKKPEVPDPRSELTLDPEELSELIKVLQDNLEPFKAGAAKWISLEGDIGAEEIDQLRGLFANPDKAQLLEFLTANEILSTDLMNSLEHQKRCRAVDELEQLLEQDLPEANWQKWFEENDWVLGTEFVRVLDERPIDVQHISDYLMEAYDGFLDLVEIKRPEGGLRFWADALDHNNYVPHSDLVKAITQASKYLYEIEREANSVKTLERLGGVKAIKPRAVLIFGRSNDWNDEQREAYRILIAGYHNLTILTFDHVLDRAKRMLGLTGPESGGKDPELPGNDDDIPF